MGPDAAIVARCMRGCLRDLDALAHAKRGQRRPYERVEEQGLQVELEEVQREGVGAGRVDTGQVTQQPRRCERQREDDEPHEARQHEQEPHFQVVRREEGRVAGQPERRRPHDHVDDARRPGHVRGDVRGRLARADDDDPLVLE